MAVFVRGLHDEMIRALNAAYDQGGWWRHMADDPELFLAVRDNTLNVYYRGNSLVLVSYEAGHLIGRTHYKYLLKPRSRLCYIRSTDGHLDWPDGLVGELLLQDLGDIAVLKAASLPYAGEEKSGVHHVLQSNPNIVDVEIAFGEEAAADDQAQALRIDFAALQEGGTGSELVFFEAKHMFNSELRASGAAEPSVIHQIRNYERFLTQHQHELAVSYQQVCQNLAGLRGRSAAEIIKRVADGAPLSVSTTPRLVVFGFDEDQHRGAVWGNHRQKLIDALGRDRVLLRGNPAGFTRGICASSS
jgi:hypothetical protein